MHGGVHIKASTPITIAAMKTITPTTINAIIGLLISQQSDSQIMGLLVHLDALSNVAAYLSL